MTDNPRSQASPSPDGRLWQAFIRFLLSGTFNTAATYGLYLVLLRFLSYRTSYTITYLTGILLVYCLSRYFVFRAKGGMVAAALFPLVYLIQYLAGLSIVSFCVEVLDLSAALAPFAAVALTIPLTFVLTRWIFVGRKA
jgi:putative flippase GtrA